MADFDVRGSVRIEITDAVRDLTRVQQELRNVVSEANRLDRQLDDLSRRRVDIDVRVDIANQLQLDMLWDQLEAMQSTNWEIKVDLDLGDALARLSALEALLRRVSTTPYNIDVDVQTAGAMANIAALNAQLALLSSQTVNINTNMNRDMDAVSGAMGRAASSAGGFGLSLSGLLGPLALLATAIVPVTAALAGLGAGMLGAFSAVGVGIAAFATFAIPTFSKITKGAEELKKAQEAVKNATTAEQIKKALEDQKKVLEGLSPLQMQAIKNLNAFKESYQQLTKALEPTAFKVFAEALNVAQIGMFQLAMIAQPAGDAIAGVLKKMSDGLKGDSWTKFFSYMRENVGFFIDTWLTGFGNIITAIANLIVAFDPLSKSVSNGFLGMSERFLEWSKHLDSNKSFQNWIAYVKREGPGMWETLKDILGTLKDFAVAVAPIGLKVLEMVGKFADFTNGLKESNPELYKMIVNFGAFALLLSPLLGPLAAVLGLFIAMGAVATGIAAAIVLVAAGFAILYTRSEEFREAVNRLISEGLEKLRKMWALIKEDFERIWPGIVKLWKIYGESIIEFAKQTWLTIQLIIKGAYDVIMGILKIFIGLFTADWDLLWEGVKQTLQGVGELLVGILKAAIDRMMLVINLFGDWIEEAFGGAWKKVSETISGWWDTIKETTSKKLDELGRGLEFFFTDLPNKVGTWMVNFGLSIAKGLSNAAMSVFWFGVDFLVKIGNINLFDAGIKLIQGLWDGIKNKWDSMVKWVEDKLGVFKGLFPSSPPKWGPFSGKGYTTYSGNALISDFRKGMEYSAPALFSSASSIMQRVNMGGGMAPVGLAVGALTTGNANNMPFDNRRSDDGISELVGVLIRRPIVVQVDSQTVARAVERGNKTLDRRR